MRIATRSSVTSVLSQMSPAVGRVLGRVVEDVDEHLREAHRIADTGDRQVGNGHVQAVVMRIDQRSAGFDGARQHVAQVDGLLVDDELSARHAVDVEQFIDDARQVLALAVDGLAHGLDERIIEIAAPHERHGIANRCEWIAQFVRQHRDELVHSLRSVGERLGVPALRQVLRHHVIGATPRLVLGQASR